MAIMTGVFTGANTINYKNKKTGADEHFRKAFFIEKGGTGKPFEIKVSDFFILDEMAPTEINTKIVQNGYNISIELIEL